MSMSKKLNAKRQLLASVSALALTAAFPAVAAADEDRPVLWLEAGAQLEQLWGGQESFEPPFVSTLLQNPFTPPSVVQGTPRNSIDEEGSILFNPEGSDWVFSASVRYGKATKEKNAHQETAPVSAHRTVRIPAFGIYITDEVAPRAQRFANTLAQSSESDLVLDFMAGKDVGLGLFGLHGSSTVSAGIRIAQFGSRSNAKIDSDPDFAFSTKYHTSFAGFPAVIRVPKQNWDLYSAKLTASRSFRGMGPSLSWSSDALLAGQPDNSAITFDWGLNAALLFGRQKVRAHHETVEHHGSSQISRGSLPTVYSKSYNVARSRSVTVPNVGGFAGISYRYADAKISLGYRADMFFGAIDGGIDTVKKENRGFFGPYASISIGIGD